MAPVNVKVKLLPICPFARLLNGTKCLAEGQMKKKIVLRDMLENRAAMFSLACVLRSNKHNN